MEPFLDRLLDQFGLTDDQRAAAAERRRNLAVTAGAGSGKTRTLVARYLGLLGQGLVPRRVVAITFTEKAAREMRSRARLDLRKQVLAAGTEEERQFWAGLDVQMDSARVGTIHSLCAEILRSHPAEAGMDPRAGVVEENQAAVLRRAALQNGLVWAVQQPDLAALFRAFSLGALERLLAALLAKRLEVRQSSFDPRRTMEEVERALRGFLEDSIVSGVCDEIRSFQASGALVADANEGLAAMAVELLNLLDTAAKAAAAEDPAAAFLALFKARRGCMRANLGKRDSRVKQAVADLRARYDSLLQPWLGGSKAEDPPPDPDTEQLLVQVSPLLGKVYARVLELYQAALDEAGGLDFDDLEAGTLALLRNPGVCAAWQREVAAVLVDEFQDTNARQREIILALAGDEPGRLFVVGDARQSIYRFRGADVTVFTGLQDDIRRQGGLGIDLDQTFRAHPDLLESTGALLAPVMGSAFDPQQPFRIPYAALRSQRSTPRPGTQPPYVECILAAAEDSESARRAAAQALARRLLELRSSGEIPSWDQVALLFRASTTFPVYEQALESAGIPFVTVAGSGFYERPEVRDLLNMLRALADPWDDQAMAGLLRSPAFGLSDPGLYRLRGEKRNLRAALNGDLAGLAPDDQGRARRALDVLGELEPQVDHLPVAELLRRLVALTDYQAVLASNPQPAGSARLWQNLDKLLGDAQASGQVRVRAFLEYIATLRDIGAREGEAAPEAEGALRLMTIHKSKGLEFPIVVLADAARRPNPGRDTAYRLGPIWTYPLDKLEISPNPLAFRLARWQDSLLAAAEDLRLLYVALTRAQEKLIVSGHLRLKNGGLLADGWLKALLDASMVLPNALLEDAGTWKRITLTEQASWAVWLAPLGGAISQFERLPAPPWPEAGAGYLYGPLPAAVAARPGERPKHKPPVLAPQSPPARVVGEMVHKALQRWLFPGDSQLEPLLRSRARQEGLVNEELLRQGLRQSEALLRRFQGHALYAEMNAALERHHELPYVGPPSAGDEGWGFMDCLYRTPSGWTLVDFKTDELRSQQAIDEAVKEYTPQLMRYRRAAEQMLGVAPQAQMCFLNALNRVQVVSL